MPSSLLSLRLDNSQPPANAVQPAKRREQGLTPDAVRRALRALEPVSPGYYLWTEGKPKTRTRNALFLCQTYAARVPTPKRRRPNGAGLRPGYVLG